MAGKSGGAESKITLGGWYQRTTLHLSEVHEFLSRGTSKLPLDKATLKKNRASLNLRSVTREAGSLDAVVARTRDGINIRYYEDGLFVLEMPDSTTKTSERKLKEYYDTHFKPAIGYLFSLGAPTPKVVANIPDSHPIVITSIGVDPHAGKVDEERFGKPYQRIEAPGISIVKTETHILVRGESGFATRIGHLVESHIFFREFKDQLGKYLLIHRTIWEDIARIKERKEVRIKQAAELKTELEQFRMTINLIGSRIDQMDTFVRTRASVVEKQELAEELQVLFSYRFEVLLDTLEYIKDIWSMTDKYLEDAIGVLQQVENQGTKVGIQSLRAITTFSVVVALINFAWQSKNLQGITSVNVLILLSVVALAYFADRLIRWRGERALFRLKFKEQAKF